jgi:hypothetical protein
METKEKVYLTIHWNRALFEELIVAHLVKKSPVICGTRSFITVLTRSQHWTYPEPVESSPHYRVHKIPSQDRILSQLNPVLILTLYIFKI